MSPFEVDATQDRGYYAENTLAGSRLNTNVSDLAASITVVTKQQLTDTASVDINDVFLYEANTEGTGNFTDFSIDTRGAFQDRAAGFQGGAPSLPFTPHTANRVRGIPGRVDKMRDYYPGNPRLPWDAYNTDSVEINRGPNSILFGLGSPAGIVNQSVTRARLEEPQRQIEFRVSDLGGYRVSAGINQPLIEDKLGIYVAALYEHEEFEREPSQDITRRQFGAITFRPFPRTTIRANYEHYLNDNRRPNFVTPRDFVSPWIAAGRPSYNPVTGMLTANGAVTGPFDGSDPDSALALMEASGNTLAFDGNVRPVLKIEQGRELAYDMRQLSSTPAEAGVAELFTFDSPVRATKSQGPETRRNVVQGLPAGLTFAQPGVTDRTIYDYENINIISGNFGRDEADVYQLDFEQEIVDDLFLQLGYYREDFRSSVQYYISQQTGVTLYVDTNEVNLDGTPNPNFGRPFIEITQPDGFEHPEDNSTGRATLAYEFDLTEQDGWVRWLGRHRLLGLWQQQEIKRSQLRYRPLMTTHTQFYPVLENVWTVPNPNVTHNAIERRFYVGGTDGLVTMDPGLYPNGIRDHTIHWFNPSSGAWEDTPITVDTQLHFVSNKTRQKIDSYAGALQSFFWDDRIVVTYGRRRDDSESRTSEPLTFRNDGTTDPTNLDVFGEPQEATGYTDTYGVVVRPLSWLSLHYNNSENFQPAALGTDFFNNPLPLPSGEGEDYGVSFTLLENKLYARLNWYEATQDNSRGALIGQALSRTFTVDDQFFRGWAQMVTGSETGTSPEVLAILQLPEVHASAEPGNFFNVPVDTTSTVDSKGLEFQLTYNPTQNWTIKLNAARQETVFSNIGPEWDEWVAERMPLWTSASAEGFPNFWETTGADFEAAGLTGVGPGSDQTVADWWFSNVGAIVSTAKRLEGKVTQDQREWRANLITNYYFDEGRFRGLGIGGAVRWEDEAVIGYLGSEPDPDGIIRSLDVNRPVFDDAETHLDLWASYTFERLPFFGDETRAKIQINVRDALEDGDLKPVAVNPDGTPTVFRIVDPRQWFLTTTFEF